MDICSTISGVQLGLQTGCQIGHRCRNQSRRNRLGHPTHSHGHVPKVGQSRRRAKAHASQSGTLSLAQIHTNWRAYGDHGIFRQAHTADRAPTG